MTEDVERRQYLFRRCTTKQEVHDWVYVFLDLDLPGDKVDEESTTTPLDMVWESYAHFIGAGDQEASRSLYYSCRDGGKTLCESVIEVLALLHLDVSIVHLASIEEQSRNAQRYLKKFFMLPDLRGFVRGDNVRETEVVLFRHVDDYSVVLSENEFRALPEVEKKNYKECINRAEIVVATMQSVNGKHALLLVLDEIDVLQNPVVYQEAANIPTAVNRDDGTTQLPLTVLTSTRKTAFGLVQDEINRAEESGLTVTHWNILDVTQRCPPSRHLPLLPKVEVYASKEDLKTIDEDIYRLMPPKEREKYAKTECYQGCVSNCKMFAACRGRLATKQPGNSRFLKPVKHTQNQFRNNTIEMAQAQLLCWKPASIGLIYSRFDKAKHVISPAQCYKIVFGELPKGLECGEKTYYTKAMLTKDLMGRGLEAYGGLDFGHTHCFAFVGGFKDGPLGFITHSLSIPELDPGQMINAMEPFKPINFSIYPDTADPGMIKLLKRAGFRMVKWSKKPGSVVGGINVVKYKLNPPMGDPELFLVRDIEEDSGMDILIKQMMEYHWKTDSAGKPTDIPTDTDDDSCDAERYFIMNVFTPKGALSAAAANLEEETRFLPSEPLSGYYDKDHWMQQIISQNTGQPMEIMPPKERRMVISSPDGQEIDIGSYYEQQNKPVKKEENGKTTKKGKKGGLVWEF
jgi:Phage terminase large subunit